MLLTTRNYQTLFEKPFAGSFGSFVTSKVAEDFSAPRKLLCKLQLYDAEEIDAMHKRQLVSVLLCYFTSTTNLNILGALVEIEILASDLK